MTGIEGAGNTAPDLPTIDLIDLLGREGSESILTTLDICEPRWLYTGRITEVDDQGRSWRFVYRTTLDLPRTTYQRLLDLLDGATVIDSKIVVDSDMMFGTGDLGAGLMNNEELARARAYGIANMRGRQPAAVATKVDRWRRENPNAFHTWTTKRGCVVQFWGMRVYYGKCRDCSRLVTTRRNIMGRKHREGETKLGRWPELCSVCRKDKYESHAASARYRMARLRRERYKFRDEQFAKAGLPPVRQGVSSGLTDPRKADQD
ncbi:hypothetical protein [Mycobacterium avium]|uniref:hypothetical protein n=1 Tax=Mycobacterium avium TaxID=1764 RepID=UPI000CE47681|nr:hypothetical protein [Mycobacterium avium]